MSLGDKIRAKRKTLSLTLSQLAEMTGMKASNLSDIEKNKRDIRTTTLNKIAAALNCNPAELYDTIYYEYEEEITGGLQTLINDNKIIVMMNITETEIDWMKSIRFRHDKIPSKQDYIDLLFIFRNIGDN